MGLCGYRNNQRHFAFICKPSLKTDIYLILSSPLIISFSTARSQSSSLVNICTEGGNPPSACLCWVTLLAEKARKIEINHCDDLPSSFSDKEPQILLCCAANMRTGRWVAVGFENPLQTHWPPLPWAWAQAAGKAVKPQWGTLLEISTYSKYGSPGSSYFIAKAVI